MRLGIIVGGSIKQGDKIGDEKAVTALLPFDQALSEMRAIKKRGGDGFDVVSLCTVEKRVRYPKSVQDVAPDATPITPENTAPTEPAELPKILPKKK